MKQNLRAYVIILVGLILSIVSTLMIIQTDGALGFPLIVMFIGFIIVSFVVYDFTIGIYILLLLGTFMFYIDRLINIPIPLGVVFDALIVITFLAIFLKRRESNSFAGFVNLITVFFIIITAYQLLQFFNPNSVSKIGWLVSMRGNTAFLLYVIFLQLFVTIKSLKRFTFFWLGLALSVAFYGIYQEIFGLTEFEWRWINEVPERIRLYFIWGDMRKFSFLSDASAYGLFTAFGGLTFLCLVLGPFSLSKRLLFLSAAVVMFISMSFSGTRTAYAMVVVGLVFIFLLNLNNIRVVIFTLLLFFGGMVVLFGPFYGTTINRIRSTFNLSGDASLSVRDVKRIGLQGYVRSHPLGGGLATTGGNGLRYSPGHPLAQGWDPDSGYLRTALELGWIGLIIFMSFFFILLFKGINTYFWVSDPVQKNYILVYIVPFFALSIAHFTQDAMYQKPVLLIIIASYAVVGRISNSLMDNSSKN